MTQGKAAASASKGAAARAERNGKAKKIEWRGVTLTLPPALEEVDGDLFFAMAEAEQGSPSAIAATLRSIVGDEQYAKVREAIRGTVTFGEVGEVLAGLMISIFDVYGTSPGESSASTKSSGTPGDS